MCLKDYVESGKGAAGQVVYKAIFANAESGTTEVIGYYQTRSDCIKAINQYAKGIEGIRPHELGFKVGVIVEKDGDLKLSVKKVYSNVYGDYALIWEKEPTHE